jgi:hypothetical protein
MSAHPHRCEVSCAPVIRCVCACLGKRHGARAVSVQLALFELASLHASSAEGAARAAGMQGGMA